MTADEVYPGVFISDIKHVREHNVDEFDRVVTVCQDSTADHLGDGIEYEQFNLADGRPGAGRGELSYRLFREAAITVADAIQAGERVLVHCHAGVSRAPSVTAAAVGVSEPTSFRHALVSLSDHRPIINPNSYLRGYGEAFVVEHTDG